MAASVEQLQNLGYQFIQSTQEGDPGIFIYRPSGYGRVAALERLSGETAESLEAEGITLQESDMKEFQSLPGFGYASGNVKTLDQAMDSAGSTVDYITESLKAQDGDSIAVGNETVSRESLQTLLGIDTEFSQASQDAQAAAGEAAAATKDAAIAARSESLAPATSSGTSSTAGAQARGMNESTRTQRNVDGTYSIIGTSTGTVYQSGLPDVESALSAQQAMMGGSTPDAVGAFSPVGGGQGTPGGGGSLTDLTNDITSSISEAEAAALAGDQSLIVTPEMRAEWLAQAVDELTPYYQETITNLEQVFSIDFQRLTEDLRTSESALAESYRTGVASLQTSLRDRGLLYGGVRTNEEDQLASTTNTELTNLDTAFTRSLQDLSTGASNSVEQTLGSTGAQNLENSLNTSLGSVSMAGRVLSGTPGLVASTTNADLLDIRGGITGSVPNQQTEDEYTRAGDLETAFTSEITRTL